MDAGKKKQGVLYIEGNSLFFYPGENNQMVQFAYPQDSVGDLEILNPQKFSEALLLFFQSQKIPPSEILFVFSPTMLFEKESAVDDKREIVQAFLDYVPFDEVLSRSFPMNKKIRTFAINGDFYHILRQIIEKCTCVSAGVVAYTSLVESTPELSQKVDLPLILAKFDTFKQFSLEQITQQQEVSTTTVTNTKPSNKRVFLLLGVFGILVIFLIGMIFFTNQTTQSPAVNTAPRSLPPAISTIPSVIPTVIPTQSSAVAPGKSL